MNLQNISFSIFLAFFSKLSTPLLKFLLTIQLFKAMPAEQFVNISFCLLIVGLCSSALQSLFNPLLILKLKKKHDDSEVAALVASFVLLQILCSFALLYFLEFLWAAVFILVVNSSALSAFERGRDNIIRGTLLFNFIQPLLENIILFTFIIIFPMDINASNLAIILLSAAFPIYMILTLLNINLIRKKIYFSANDFLITFKQIKFYIFTMFSSEINSRGITLVVLYFVDANIAASYRVLSQLASAVGIAANSVLFVLRPTISASDWKVGNRLSETYYFEVWKKYGLAALSSLVCIWPLYILFIADLVETGSGDSAWLLAFLLVLGVSNVIFGPTFIFTGVWAPENRVDIFNLVLKLISLAIATISGYVLGSIYVILSIFILGQLIVQFVAFKKLEELFWKVNV